MSAPGHARLLGQEEPPGRAVVAAWRPLDISGQRSRLRVLPGRSTAVPLPDGSSQATGESSGQPAAHPRVAGACLDRAGTAAGEPPRIRGGCM